MRPHEPGRSSGRAPRPQGAAVGRTAGKVDGAWAPATLPAAHGRYMVV